MIVGMAGHIDHGKSALVEALTGKGMDPHAEERRRGITLDLHFAPLVTADGRKIGIVDVPGHEDLIRTMIAGASGIDLLLLVVAADDGPMPQTREHLLVAEALGVSRGIPVLTKGDLADRATRGALAAALAEWLGGSRIEFEPPIVVSSRTGEGIEELARRIGAAPPHAGGDDAFRLPVDRVFSVAGVGTVVTGTAWSGSVAVGDRVRLLPRGVEARVRSIETFGEERARSAPGERVAVGLAGVGREDATRGDVLVTDVIPWAATTALDAAVELAADAPRPLASRSRVRVHLGTTEVMARVSVPEAIAPGTRGTARLSLEGPIVARGGDRLVLRSFSPVGTIGGGVVLDPAPPRRSRVAGLDPDEDRLGLAVGRRRDGVSPAALRWLTGLGAADLDRQVTDPSRFCGIGGRILPADLVERWVSTARELVRGAHQENPTAPGLPLDALRKALRAPEDLVNAVVGLSGLVAADGVVRRPDFVARKRGADPELDSLVARIESAGLTPPPVAELAQREPAPQVEKRLRLAAEEGRLVAVTREWFVAPAPLERLAETLRELGAAGPITVAAVRERLGLSRKYLIPLLEWADRTGVTLRNGDVRVLPRRRA